MIVVIWLTTISLLHAQDSIITGERVSRHENPNYVVDSFADYIKSYNSVLSENSENPYNQALDAMYKGVKANEMADIHWNNSISSEQYNQVLITAIGLYNQSIENKRPILEYLSRLSNLFAENEKEQSMGTKLTKSVHFMSWTWFGLMVVTNISKKSLPKQTHSSIKKLSSSLSSRWASLIPKASNKTNQLNKTNTDKGWRIVRNIGAIGGLSVVVATGWELLSNAIKGPRLDPRPLISMTLANDAKILAKKSCDMKLRLEDNDYELEDELSSAQDLVVHLRQTHEFLDEYAKRFNITHDPFTPELMTALEEEEKKLSGIRDIILKGVNVHPDCDKDNVNLSIALANIDRAETILKERLN